MLAGISHRVPGSFVLAQPEKKKCCGFLQRYENRCLVISLFSGSTGSFEGERCGEGEQAKHRRTLPYFRV